MLESLKQHVCQANLDLVAHGLVTLTWGNVSGISDDREHFAIKPSGVDYDKLTADDMVILDFDGNTVEGDLRPSSDTPTHRCLFLNFPGIRAVVHTHSRSAVAFAQAGVDVPCLGTTHCDYFHGSVPVTRGMTPEEVGGEYEWETGMVIVERFTCAGINPLDVPAVLVRNHGPFAWGPSGAKAVETAQALEIVSDMAIKTLAINATAPAAPAHLLDKHFFRKHGPGAYYGQPK